MTNLLMPTLPNIPFHATSTGAWILYLLTFPNGMQYIGITSQPLAARVSNGNGYYYNEEMMQAIASCGGWKFVKLDVLYADMPMWLAGKMERLMIARYNTLWPFGYNREDGGFVDVHTFRKNSYPVKQIDPDTGEMVRMWRSAQLAEENGRGKHGQKLSARHIRDVIAGRSKSHGDWKWEKATWEEFKSYDKEQDAKLPKVIHVIAPRKRTEETANRYAEKS